MIHTHDNLDSQLIGNARDVDLVEVLELLRNGANLNAMDEYGNTALMCASYMGYLEAVRALLNENVVHVNVGGEFGNTALIWASMRGHSGSRTCFIESRRGGHAYHELKG